MKQFRQCPKCGGENHRKNLIYFFIDDSKKEIRDQLITALTKNLNPSVKLGILCCSCYSEIEDKTTFNTITFNEPRIIGSNIHKKLLHFKPFVQEKIYIFFKYILN